MGFNDVNTGTYYCYALQFMARSDKGYVTGESAGDCATYYISYPCYLPTNPVKRGEFSQILVATYQGEMGWGSDNHGQYFTDVPPSNIFFHQINALYYRSIITGYTASQCAAAGATYPCFLPNNYIRHDEATIFLDRAGGYALQRPSRSDFADVATTDYEYQALEGLYYASIIYPDPNTNKYFPSHNLNRADTVYYVYRTIYLTSVASYLGQIVTRKQTTGPYQGVDEFRTAPYGNDKGHAAAGPVAISNYLDRFMESGPSANYYVYGDPIYGDTGDGGLHPYTSFADGYAVYSFVDTSLILAPNAPYRYFSDYNGTGNRWSSFFCYGGTCKVEANAEYLGVDNLPYADALGETSNQLVHYGSSQVSYALYTPYNQYTEYPWCYDVILNNLGQITNSSVTTCNPSNNSWTIQWPVGTQPGP